jgi:hypothetical protein
MCRDPDFNRDKMTPASPQLSKEDLDRNKIAARINELKCDITEMTAKRGRLGTAIDELNRGIALRKTAASRLEAQLAMRADPVLTPVGCS